MSGLLFTFYYFRYNPIDQIEYEGYYKNGKRYGKWIHYNEDGTTNKEEFYEEGEVIKTINH